VCSWTTASCAAGRRLSNEDAAMAKWWSTQKCNEVVYECCNLHAQRFIMDYRLTLYPTPCRPIYADRTRS